MLRKIPMTSPALPTSPTRLGLSHFNAIGDGLAYHRIVGGNRVASSLPFLVSTIRRVLYRVCVTRRLAKWPPEPVPTQRPRYPRARSLNSLTVRLGAPPPPAPALTSLPRRAPAHPVFSPPAETRR